MKSQETQIKTPQGEPLGLNFKERGKKNRESGIKFESKVRKDLEKQGWIVAKWTNNIKNDKLVPAKHKFNPFKKIMTIGTGFPDFIAFKKTNSRKFKSMIVGFECKSNGYLKKEEKAKIKWLLKNNIFNMVFLVKKGNKKIIYKEMNKWELN